MALHVGRGGAFLRVADPAWDDPLDGSFAGVSGGRWNPPNSFPTLYLSATHRVARANVDRLFVGLPYGPEDLDPPLAPGLVEAMIDDTDVADIVTDDGCLAVGLPDSYPFHWSGVIIGHEECQQIGAMLQGAGEPGIAVRSAAPGMDREDEELVWFRFDSDGPQEGRTWPFLHWYPTDLASR